MAPRFTFLWVLLVAHSVLANIEKIVFKGPNTANIPSQHPTLEDLHIDVLSPQDWLLRTHLEAEWPKLIPYYGKQHWFLLDNLNEGQRYEIRVCWAATQPSAFRLRTHELSTVWETPDLISNLAEYSASRQHETSAKKPVRRPLGNATKGERETSVLFLQVFAAGDYFSLNETLMENIAPIYIDIILDPYLWNMIPLTLLPVIGYIAVIVIPSFLLGRRLLSWLRTIAASNPPGREKSE